MKSPLISRRDLLASLASVIGNFGVAPALGAPAFRLSGSPRLASSGAEVIEQVVPKAGVPTDIVFGDSIQKLIAGGVLDPARFRATANDLPAWVDRLLTAPSGEAIVFNDATAPYLVDLLWPIGLANRTTFNERSPLTTPSIPTFASTGGWTLGEAPNGYVYFNTVDVARLSAEQQRIVEGIARATYRPCCDNSTFFQDCNHGSALLGLLELAASQGASVAQIYRLALTANSYWFPDQYARTGLYFWHFRRTSWRGIEPKVVLGAAFSSASGWARNVAYPLERAGITLPGVSGGEGC